MVDQAIAEIDMFDPHWLYVDPTHLAFLIRGMRERGTPPPAVRAIALTYTLATEVSVRQIREFFGDHVPRAEIVSMSELGWVAVGCPTGNMHLNNTNRTGAPPIRARTPQVWQMSWTADRERAITVTVAGSLNVVAIAEQAHGRVNRFRQRQENRPRVPRRCAAGRPWPRDVRRVRYHAAGTEGASMTVAAVAKPRVLSGITATGRLTIGNYVGALGNWVDEQDQYENYFFVADLHALTIPENIRAGDQRRRVREIVALYLASGLDPARSVLFLQSTVPQHTTLAWIFECVTPVSWLERMTQYKSKSTGANPSGGLLTYPALMAADILLYQPRYVPVGDDQRQHIELTKDVAQRFNHMFGEVFTIPEPLIRESGARIMGLDDPLRR